MLWKLFFRDEYLKLLMLEVVWVGFDWGEEELKSSTLLKN
jgi:hypothetical protein